MQQHRIQASGQRIGPRRQANGSADNAIGLALGGAERVMVLAALDLRFRAPVRLGDTLTVTCTVTAADPERSRITVTTTVATQTGTVVIEGTITLWVTSKKK